MIYLIMFYCVMMFVCVVAGGYVIALAILSKWEQHSGTVFVEHNGECMSVKRYYDNFVDNQ